MTGVTVETFLDDVDVREIPWTRPSGTPAALDPDRVLIASGADALEVAVAVAARAPKVDDVRRLWSSRWNRRAAPVVLVVGYPENGAWKAAVCGTKDDPAVLPDLDLGQVERICAAALVAPDPANGERTLHRLLVGQKDQLVAGLTNSGLFASYELRTGVPTRSDWATARVKAQPLLDKRGADLIRGLGYTATPHGSTAMILTANISRRAVAVLLDEHEVFDRPAARFGADSPVAQGLTVAEQQDLKWLIITRGTQIRLYPANPDVGVGRKGQTETYTEVDLALLTEHDAAYLSLLFSADALAEQGSVQEILSASADHVTALGERLRDRVYVDVVPRLAIAVANRMRATTEAELTEAYHRTLTILFRLLFLAYAEDRGLLPYQRNPRYTRRAIKTLAREFTDNPNMQFDPTATDRWEDLLAVWKAVDGGNKEWGVPAYNGGLLASDDAHPSGQAISAMRLTNAEIGPVLRSLLVDTAEDGTTGPVDFRSLSVREFGTIYEGLLESSLSIAPGELTVDARTGAFVPANEDDEVVVDAGQVYFHNSSGARKASGSYFTKAFAVERLLDTALEPALTDHLTRVRTLLDAGDEAAAGGAFFDFRVGDLAMGSGHFLVAAIDRIENRFRAFLTSHHIPAVRDELARLAEVARTALGNAPDIEVEPSALLRRQIARRSIYGIDLNPMAVELARLGIWIHTFVPGLPMSALDHGLVVGNSLTGISTIDEVLDVLEPERTPGQHSLFAQQIESVLGQARDRLARVGRTAEATKQEVREAARAHTQALVDAADAKALLDAAIAVRLDVIPLPNGPDEAIAAGKREEVQAHTNRVQAAHFPYLFPEVFLRENPGFNVLLGNPPWEKVKVEEHQWWALRFPGLRSMPQRDKNRAIARYRADRPDLTTEYEAEVARVEDLKQVLGKGPFPGLRAATDTDLSLAFAWRFWQLIAADGRLGIVLPRGVLAGTAGAQWRLDILERGSFSEVTMLTNNRQWIFDEVHPQYTVALTAVVKGSEHAGIVAMRGPYFSLAEFFMRVSAPAYRLSADEFATWADGAAFPLLPQADSLVVFGKLRAHPRLDADAGEWHFVPVRELHTTDNRSMYDFDLDRPSGDLPVLTGASFNLWDPDFGQPYAYGVTEEIIEWLQERRLRQVRLTRSAFYGMPQAWANDPDTLPICSPRIAFRDVARATDSRTVITALIPPDKALVEKAPYLFRKRGTSRHEAYLLGILSSLPLDWYARRYVELKLSYTLLNAFPIPRPDLEDSLATRVVELAGRLAARDVRYGDWAAEVGVTVGSVPDQATETDLIAELDAVVALLYGLSRTDLEHLYATFHRGWDNQARLVRVLRYYDSWRAEVGA